jgi:hypothetical protein
MMWRSLLTVLLFFVAAQAVQAEPTFPPAGRIGLEVPADLKVSSQFPGFEDPDRKVTVEALDAPFAGYDRIVGSLFADSPGARDIKRESFPYRAGIGYLVSGDVTNDGTTVRLYFLVGSPIASPNADNFVAFVRVSVPESARSVYSDEVVRTMLASMTFRDVPLEEQLGQLPYSINEFAGFRVFRVVAPTLLLIDGAGTDLARQAHLIVAVGQGTAATPDDRARAARNLMATAPFRDITLQMAEPMRLAGAPAYEIRAQAQTGTGQPVTLVQWVRFGSAGYMKIVGVSPRDSWEQFFPRFRAVRDGIGSR